jgi:hypothetical protein
VPHHCNARHPRCAAHRPAGAARCRRRAAHHCAAP